MVCALLAGLVSSAVPGTADASCAPPPEVFPVDDLHPGMTATGITVIQGTTPTPFDVTILGVSPNGIAPGVDFILAQITGPPSFLDLTGGIVAGMSGSPVSIGGKLVGSTSYGFPAADQTMMGITPAQPMVDLFGYPDAPPAAARATADAVAAARTVRLGPSLRQAAARATGKATASSFPGVAHQLTTPLAVSGVDNRGLTRLQRFITNRLHLPVTVYGSTASGASSPSPAPLAAGDSLAAGISYGDITAGAVGTATVVCGDMVVGFGHPFLFDGAGHLGLNGADVLAVIKDPSTLFGGYKFATITGLHGTIDQDRLTGVRGTEGLIPHLAHVVSTVTNLDIAGRTHQGGSQIVSDPFTSIVTALTLLSEEDTTYDRIGGGSTHVGWTIRGTDPDGNPFKLHRDNRYYSGGDATLESIFELLGELDTLQFSRFGSIHLSSVRTNSEVTQRRLTTSIRRILVSSALNPGLQPRTHLQVRAGGTIHVQAQVMPAGATHLVKENLSIQLPTNSAGRGQLFVGGGGGGFGSGLRAESFGEILSRFRDAPHTYDVVAALTLVHRTASGNQLIHRRAVRALNRVVLGGARIGVSVVP
ncbi:MAG: SpoIVB peptidase S55 domain-containing protein [Actinomycetota bacterium]